MTILGGVVSLPVAVALALLVPSLDVGDLPWGLRRLLYFEDPRSSLGGVMLAAILWLHGAAGAFIGAYSVEQRRRSEGG